MKSLTETILNPPAVPILTLEGLILGLGFLNPPPPHREQKNNLCEGGCTSKESLSPSSCVLGYVSVVEQMVTISGLAFGRETVKLQVGGTLSLVSGNKQKKFVGELNKLNLVLSCAKKLVSRPPQHQMYPAILHQ